jgi:exopolyphosphatase/pppGpp-phosphohydrolase
VEQEIAEECGARVKKYREKMAGKSSPRRAWREGLPGARHLRTTGLARLSEWAWFLTPDFAEVRRTARLALQLYDGLANQGLVGRESNLEERFILQSAALLQEVGHAHHKKPHHKEAYRMIRRLSPPPGWTKKDLELVALVARFHRRALPRTDHKLMKSYEYPVRHALVLLAAVLRFANALREKPYRAIRHLDVEDCSGVLVVRAEGFSEQAPLEPKLAEARRLLEFTCQKSVHILSPGTRMIRPRQQPAPARIHAA